MMPGTVPSWLLYVLVFLVPGVVYIGHAVFWRQPEGGCDVL
jgi:hypothetical protein